MFRVILAIYFIFPTMTSLASSYSFMVISEENISKQFPHSNNVKFKNQANDGQIYQGTVACFANWQEGSISIKKNKTHIGVSTVIGYDRCCDLLADLRNQAVQLKLWWDKNAFDEAISGKLHYEVQAQ